MSPHPLAVYGQKVLVTGSHGFIGKRLCEILRRERECQITMLDLKIGYDIREIDFYQPRWQEHEWVFHLAAQTDAQTPDYLNDATTNILGSLRIFDAFRARTIYSSSTAVHHPTTPYGISKRAAEEYALLCGCSVVRFCNIFGPGGHGVIDNFQKFDVPEMRGSGDQFRTYAYVDDACTSLLNNAGRFGLHMLGGFDLRLKDIVRIFGKRVTHVEANPYDVLDGRQFGAEGEPGLLSGAGCAARGAF